MPRKNNRRKVYTRDNFMIGNTERSQVLALLRWAHPMGMEGGLGTAVVSNPKTGDKIKIYTIEFMLPSQWSDRDVETFRYAAKVEMEKCQ